MDDIYFSDKKKKQSREGTPERRISSDSFRDTDYFDESFSLDFKPKGTSNAFSSQGSFNVNIPEEELFSSGEDRTPRGRPLSLGETAEQEAGKEPSPHRELISHREDIQGEEKEGSIAMAGTGNNRNTGRIPQTQRTANQRTPQGARVPAGANQRPVRMSREGSPSHQRPPQKPQRDKKKTIALSVAGVVVAFLLFIIVYGLSALGGLNYDDSIKENAYVDESTLVSDSNVINILFLGSDARSEVEGQRSDTMMLFSIDKNNKKLKLTSFLRDSYVYIPSKQYNTKLNAAFSYGGTQLVMDTLEYNFGVKLDHYIMVDFDAFRQLVNLLGGITVEGVTEAEAKYMREEVKIKNIKEGTNEMNGKAALWYCRIRYVDNDFKRTERQRKVISAIVEKALKTNPVKLVSIVKKILPNISTDISQSELIGLAMGAALRYIHYDIQQQQIPAPGTWTDAWAGNQQVLKMDIYENADILKAFLYEKDTKEEKSE